MDNEYMNNYMKRRYQKRRGEAITKLGGVCSHCGTDANLTFHHKDPSEKSFTLARGSSYSQERWDEEVDKCELLCGDCHIDHHRSRAEHGTMQRYWRGCRCPPCLNARNEYNREYRRTRAQR